MGKIYCGLPWPLSIRHSRAIREEKSFFFFLSHSLSRWNFMGTWVSLDDSYPINLIRIISLIPLVCLWNNHQKSVIIIERRINRPFVTEYRISSDMRVNTSQQIKRCCYEVCLSIIKHRSLDAIWSKCEYCVASIWYSTYGERKWEAITILISSKCCVYSPPTFYAFRIIIITSRVDGSFWHSPGIFIHLLPSRW